MFKIMDMAIWPINKMIHKALQLDPESLDKLAPLAGKVLAIELTGIHCTIFAAIQIDGLRLSFDTHHEPNATLIGTPFALMRLLMQLPQNNISSDIKINGDVHFIQNMQIILTGLSIDWEEQLSKWIGDHPAYHMGRFGQDVQRWLKRTRDELCSNTTEYLQQEKQQLPSHHEVNIFLRDVDELRNDVERLAVKIKDI